MYTHPRDTSTQLEFFPGRSPGDPRFEPGWDASWWATEHPLGLLGLSHATVVVADLDRAASFYTSALGGRAGDPTAHDPDVAAVREAARLIAENELLTPALVPLGDGLLAAVRD